MGILLCRGEDWGIVASKVTVSVKPHGSRQCRRGFGVSYKVYHYCLTPGVKGGGVRGGGVVNSKVYHYCSFE